jgi:hypothetical protein
MENALTLPSQHLQTYRTLKDYSIRGAYFSPTELKLETGLPEIEWLAVAKAISTVGNAVTFWAGDLIIYGEEEYGKEKAYDLAQKATGWCRQYLYRVARIARKFPPEKRVPNLSFYHYTELVKFPEQLTDRLLAQAAAEGLSARATHKLACDEYEKETRGKKPIAEKRFKAKKVAINLWTELYDKLAERAGGGRSLSSFIAERLEEYVVGGPIERQPTNGSKTKEWREKVKNAVCVVVQMTDKCWGRNTKFRDCDSALLAAETYSKEKNYPVEPYWCRVCKCLHVKQSHLIDAAAPTPTGSS